MLSAAVPAVEARKLAELIAPVAVNLANTAFSSRKRSSAALKSLMRSTLQRGGAIYDAVEAFGLG